jgi:aspartyl-tRNA synthetase
LEIQAEIPETRIRRSRKVVSICSYFFRNHHAKGLVEKWLKTITQKGWLKTITQKGWLVVFCLTAKSDLVVQIVPSAAHDKVHGVVSYFCLKVLKACSKRKDVENGTHLI